MKTREKFKTLLSELGGLGNIRVNTYRLTFYAPKEIRNRAREMGAPQQLISFYEDSDGFELDWEMLDAPDPDVLGKVGILSLADLLRNWENVVYFDDTEPDDPIRSFHPFDFFVDEACVGIYFEENFDNSLYLYDFKSEPFRLDLDIKGYIELLIASRGFLYWQDTIETFKLKTENPATNKFKTYMPQLFKDFSFDEFSSTYQHLRLSTR